MKELIEKLYDNENKFNYETVKEIKKNKGKVNSYLLEELSKNIENYNSEKGFPIFVDYALFLLAEFKEKKAFPLILKMLSIPHLDGFDVLGDGVMEKLSSIMVSVFDGDFKGLNEIIENKDIDSYIRNSALETYVYFYQNNLVDKKDLIQFLRKIILLYNYDDDIYNFILTVIISTHLIEMIPDVKIMFEQDAIDYYIRGGYAEFIDYLFNYDKFDTIDIISNIEDNMASWYCFHKEEKDNKEFDYDNMEQAMNEFIKESTNQNIINYNKIGRNDPCPCGSGKKYKKCCLNKIESTLPYQKYIDDSLKDYPKKNDNEGELDFYTIYKDEYIEIDKLLYKAMKKKNIPLFIKRNIAKENEINYGYLDEAYSLIKKVIEKEHFKTIDKYDESVSIHFNLYTFFKNYTGLIIEKIKNGKEEYIKNLEEVINYFYTTFKIDESWEFVFLDRIDDYYQITKKYKEGITFFESKLSNQYAKYHVYQYLFNLYSIVYDYDDYLKKMDDMIDKEPDKEMKEELIDLKLNYMDDEEDYDYEDEDFGDEI